MKSVNFHSVHIACCVEVDAIRNTQYVFHSWWWAVKECNLINTRVLFYVNGRVGQPLHFHNI